mgnify:CR=1 FL=1
MYGLKTRYIYEIFRGTDLGTNKTPSDYLVAQFRNYEDALAYYEKTKLSCLEKSKEPRYKMTRFYCYMTQVDLSERIIGHKDGVEIDNKFFSKTIFAHNFTQSPRLHDYMINLEGDKKYDWGDILADGLYERV